jgi:hypothetical protein
LPPADLSHIGIAPAPATAPQAGVNDTRGGTYHCIMLKVDTAYSSNKPQLQFECDGQEFPLKYTGKSQDDLVRFLQPVGAFTAAQLNKGAKFQVNYLVDWELSQPNKEGKQYKNIVGLRPA